MEARKPNSQITYKRNADKEPSEKTKSVRTVNQQMDKEILSSNYQTKDHLFGNNEESYAL